jgi:hypothetical protein
MQLLTIAGHAHSIYRWAHNGGLQSDLAELDLEAAEKAWEKAAVAADLKSQLRSVITHLESAEVKFERSLRLESANMDVWLTYRPASSRADIYDLFKVRVLMAVCYFCVDDRPLAKKMLDEATLAYRMGDNSWFTYMASISSPREAICLAKDKLFDQRTWSKELPRWGQFERTLQPCVDNLRSIFEGPSNQ